MHISSSVPGNEIENPKLISKVSLPRIQKFFGGSLNNWAFHPSESDKISTKNLWGLCGQK